jgi:hypothetical protein
MLPRGVDLEDEDTARAAVAQFVRDQETDPPGWLIRALDCLVFPFLRPFGMFLKADALVNRIFQLRTEIDDLLREAKFDVASVFVTFETEEGLRAALTALSTGKIYLMSRNASHAAPGSTFRGTLLKVYQAAEPSSIRWLDLGASKRQKVTVRTVNFVITVGVIALSGFFVSKARKSDWPSSSGVLIAIFNSVIPLLIKILMIFERHVTEGSFQTSLYLKITLFRWVNTAILVKVRSERRQGDNWETTSFPKSHPDIARLVAVQIITPFTSTVSPGPRDALVVVNSILWSELWLTPGLRLLDLMSNIRKHILAPRDRIQETMNLNFQGEIYQPCLYAGFMRVLQLAYEPSRRFSNSFVLLGTPVNMGERYVFFGVVVWNHGT